MGPLELLKCIRKTDMYNSFSTTRQNVLEILIERPAGCTTQEVAKLAGTSRNNANRQVKALEGLNLAYMQRMKSNAYRKRKLMNTYFADYSALERVVSGEK